MPKEILIRNLSPEILAWIQKECADRKMTQQEFISEMLTKSKEIKMQNPLFPYTRLLKKPEVTDKFKFIDLFAGIGGFRIALENLGGDCVFSSEWDKYSQKTYGAWFGEIPHGDIRKIKPSDIPDHDILTAGFPCQPFSIAGVSKKISLGKAHGFKDKNQGNLFFYLATIIGAKKPPVLFLENVKNLQSHDKGKTWSVIKNTLENLGYTVFYKIHDAAHWVPQHRERILIIGFDKKVFGDNPDFEFPELPKANHRLKEILEQKPNPKYTLSDHLWKYLQNYAQKHKEKGNGFGFGIADPNGITRTLSARYYKDGSEILIAQKDKSPRRLTPRECARLMGFPEAAKIVVSDTQAYRQFGNAVVVPVVESVTKEVLKIMRPLLTNKAKSSNIRTRKAVVVSH